MADDLTNSLLVKIEATTAQLRQEMKRGEQVVSSSTGRISDALSAMDKRMAGAESRAKSFGGGLNTLAAHVKAVTSTLAAGFAFSELIKATDAWTNFENRLKLVGLTGDKLAVSMDDAYKVAQKTSQDISSTASIYQRFAQNADKLNLSQKELARITETTSKAVSISGSSTESANAAMMQFGQAMASGVLRGEEFNSVNEQANGVIMAIAHGLGVTTGQLRGMANEGELTADVVTKALGKAADYIDKKFDSTTKTVAQGIVELNNSFIKLIGSFASAEAANTSLYAALSGLSKTLDALSQDSETFGRIIDGVFALAAGKAVAALVSLYAEHRKSAAATKAATLAMEEKALADKRAAVSANLQAKAELERAQLAVAAAKSELAASQARELANIKGLQGVQAALQAELSLEQQRLKAQINEQGRQLSVARMAELRLAEVAITKQLIAAEAQLAATTMATSTSVAAAQEQRAVAAGHAAATQQALNAATVSANTATRAAAAANSILATSFAALRTAGATALSLFSGPVGLIVTLGLVAASFIDFESSTDKAIKKLDDLKEPLDQIIQRFKELNRDQRAAALTKWADAQAASVLKVNEEYKKLRVAVGLALQPTGYGQAYGQQLDRGRELLEMLDNARTKGESLTPILEQIATTAGIPATALSTWKTYAGGVADAVQLNQQVSTTVAALTVEAAKNTEATDGQKKAVDGLTVGGQAYLDTLKKRHKETTINNDVVKEATRWIEDHKDASEEDKKQIMAAAKAIKQQEEANKAATQTESEASKAAKKHTEEIERKNKALADTLAQYSTDTQALQRQTAAHKAGGQAVAESTRQEQIETEVLEHGEAARTQLTAAVNAHQDALERLDLGQQYEALRLETEQLQREALATLHGTEALQAYNAEKQLSQLLAGKNAAALGMEQAELEKIIQGNLEAKRVLEQVSQVDSLMDSLYPQQARMREYTEQQEILNQAMQHAPEYAYLYQDALSKLTRQYYENNQASDQWAQLTEGALDRVNSGFADLWKSVFTGFENFSSNLKEALLQLLAELAHAATTQKIVLQLGASMGLSSVGGISTAQAAQGNSNLTGAAMNAYSLYQSGAGEGGVLSSVWDGLKSGGISGGWSALTNYGNGVLGAGDQLAGQLYGTVFNGTGMTYAPLSYQSSLAGSNVLSNLSSIATILSGALYGYQQGGLLGAGVTGAAAWGGGALGGMAGTALGSYIGGALGSVVPYVGTAIGAAIGSWLGGSLFGGSGERFKETYTSASGYYAEGSYNATGTPSQLLGKRRFGDDYDSYLNSVNEQFIGTLGNLTDLLGNGESVQSDIYARLRRTSGRIDADLWANLPGMDEASWTNSHWFRGYGGDAKDIAGQLEKFANDVLGEWLAEAITQTEALPEYFRAQFEDLAADADTTAEDVQNRISEILGRFNGINDALTRVGLTALEASDAGLQAGDSLVALSGSLEALQSNVSGYYDQFYSEQEKINNILAEVPESFSALDIDFPAIRADYRAMVEDIDVTTEAGQELFATLMALAGSADGYYDILEQRATDLLSLESNYYSLFTDSAQQQADSLAALQGGFSALGLTLPSTQQGFKDLVAGMDTSTEAGRALYESLLGLASSSAAYYTELDEAQASLEALQAESQSLAVARANSAFEALQQSIKTEQQQIEASLSTLTSLSNELAGALDNLNNSSTQSTELLRAQAKTTLASAVAQVQAGGLLTDLDQVALSDALDQVSQLNTNDYASAEDLAREQGRTANLIVQLQGMTDEQLSSEQQALEVLNQQLEQGQAQLDALNGIDNSILSVTEAVNSLNAALVAALAGLETDSSTNSAANNSALVSSVYQGVLGREADSSGLEFWTGALNNGLMDYSQLTGSIVDAALANGEDVAQSAVAQLYQSVLGRSADAGGLAFWSDRLLEGQSYNALARQLAESALSNPTESSTTQSLAQNYLSSIPAFAEGGYHSGGLRLVGEYGPELEVTGPSRIFNAQDTASLLGNLGNLGGELPSGPTLWLPELPQPDQGSSEAMLAEQASEIRGLRADIADLKDALYAIAKHTMKTAKRTEYLERWDTDGLPAERV